MRKIPTLFRRNPDDRRHLLPEVHPECQWVLDGEGVPTRKYDGTCVMLDDAGHWWARREVKPGKQAPVGFRPEQTDDVTGKTVGWEPIEASSFYRYFLAAAIPDGLDTTFDPGTYELIGPKINGNPEGIDRHILIPHDDAVVLPDVDPRSFETLKPYVLQIGDEGMEGVVWHHPDGRMAKLKARDFR